MRTMLVAPGVPNGTPATTMMRSPTAANSSRTANFAARNAMSSTSLASLVTIGCTPQTRARRRAVSRFGVRASTVEFGRSRASLSAVEPEKVHTVMALRFSASAIWCDAAAIASDPVGAGRHRGGDHRFEHLGRDHHRLAEASRGAGDALLQARHLPERHLDPEVAAGDHHGVRRVEDVVEAADRLRLLELRHDERAPARHLAPLRHVLRPLHEGHADPVDAGVDRGFEVGAVLLGHGRDRDLGVGQVDALAVRDSAADRDPRDGAPGLHLLDLESQLAVVDEDAVALLERAEDLGVGQEDALRVAGALVRIENEAGALLQHRGIAAEGAHPELRPLEVGQDRDRPPEARLDLPDGADLLAQPVAGEMAHVEPEGIGAGLEQLGHHLGRVGGRSERGDDLRASRPLHRALPRTRAIIHNGAGTSTGRGGRASRPARIGELDRPALLLAGVDLDEAVAVEAAREAVLDAADRELALPGAHEGAAGPFAAAVVVDRIDIVEPRREEALEQRLAAPRRDVPPALRHPALLVAVSDRDADPARRQVAHAQIGVGGRGEYARAQHE